MSKLHYILGLLFAGIAIFVAIGFAFSGRAGAESLSDAQVSHIKSECAQIKGSLSQLHASDALLRVNRGQAYESMASKLMNPFNSRLSTNGFDNRAMLTHTNQYKESLDNFRLSYISYEQKISEALKIDCQKKPVEFYDSIIKARELRKSVHDNVEKMNRIIADYRTSVGDFLLNYKRLAE